jgi:WD40 repeat protein
VAELQGFVVDREVLQVAPLQGSLLIQFPDEILEYDLTTRNLISRLRIPGRDMRVSPDGGTLAVLSTHVSLLDLRSGELIAMLEDARLPADFAFSPDGQYLAVTHQTGVHLYQARSGRVVRTLEGHGEPAEGLAFTADGSRLISAGGDVWDVASGEPLAVFDSSTRRATVSPNGQLIVGEDGTVWELESGQALGRVPFSSASSRRLQFVPDSSLLVRQAADGTVELWTIDPHAARAAAVPPAPATLPIGEPITPLNVWRLAQVAQLGNAASGRFTVSPGWTSAAAWSDRRVSITSLISGDITHDLASSGPILDAAYLGDEYLLVVNSQGQVERWDVATGQLRQTYPYRGHRVEASPLGGMFAVQEKYIQVVDAVTGERLFNLGSAVRIEELYPEVMRPSGGFRPGGSPDDLGQDFAFTPDGDHLAIAFGSGVSLWDLGSGRSMRQFSGHGPATGGLTFTADGARLVSASGDIWDAESGRRLAEFELQTRAVAATPGGELIAGGDGSLWDGENGQYLGTLGLQADQLWFTPNSRQLVLHAERGGVLVYAIQPKVEHVAPSGDSSPRVALAPLSVESASRLSLIGWWGEDGLLQVRNERDRSAPGADRFGTQAYRHLSLSPDAALVAALDAQGVDLLDLASGRLADRYRIFLNPSTVRELAFLGEHLLLLKEVAGLERWDLAAQELVQRYDLQGEGLLTSPDGTSFALLQDNRLLLVAAASAEVRAKVTLSPSPGNYLFSPDGSILAVARGATAELWEVAEARRVGILRGQGGSVHGLAFSLDGERLMAASGEIWDLGSGDLVGGFESSARLLAGSPRSGLFIGDDGALRSVQQGERIGTLIDLRAAAAQLLFRRDGKQVVWRTEDGRVYAYGVRAESAPVRPTPGEPALTADQASQLTLLTHLGRGRLRSALWSPDDQYLALNTTQNAVIYEAQSLRPIRSFLDAVALAFDAQGHVLIGGEAPLQLLEIETGELVRSFDLLGISAAAFSPDGTTLAIGGTISAESEPDGLALVNLSSGLLRQLDLGGSGTGAPLAVQFSPDGQTIVLSSRGMISLWDVDSGQQLRAPIRGNSRPASISPDGRLIAYFTNRFVIERLDTGGERRTINADGTPYFPTGLDIPSLRPVDQQFTPQGRLLVFYRRLDRRTFEEDLALVEWDLTASPIRGEVRLEGMFTLSELAGEHAQDYANESPQLIPAFGLSPWGALFYSLTGDGVLRVWNARDGSRQAASQADSMDRIAIGLDGSTAVIPNAQAVLEVWDVRDGELLRTVPGTWENEWLAYASATTLAVLQPEGSLAIVDLQTGEALDRLELKSYGGPAYFALGSDGRNYAQMALLAGRNSLQLYGMAPALPLLDLGRYPLPSRPVFSPDGQTLAVVNRDRVLLWDLQSGALRGELQGLGSSVGPLTFAPDGSRLIAGSGEIWEVGSGARTAQFETNNPGQRVACNGYLIIGEQGNLWDASNGASLGALAELRGPALNFGFTPDGSRLLWQVRDSVVEVWGISLE